MGIVTRLTSAIDKKTVSDKNGWLSFSVLFLILVNHSLLETARNSLFLRKLPVTQLPWVYIIIALLTLVASRWNQWVDHRFSTKRTLIWTLAFCSVINVVFFSLMKFAKTWTVWALYIWVAVLITIVLSQFWLLMTQLYQTAEAKNQYSFVALGGLLGATAGSFTSAYALSWVSEEFLLLLAASSLALAGFLVTPLGDNSHKNTTDEKKPHFVGFFEGFKDRYIRLIGISVFLSFMVGTLADYLVKDYVEKNLDSSSFGEFFGIFFGSLNLLSVMFQLVFSTKMIHWMGVAFSMGVLPLGILVSSASSIFASGFIPVLFIKGFDGTFRHSLYKTASELLFTPIESHLRSFSKIVVEGLTSRFGQAVGSIVLLIVIFNPNSDLILKVILFLTSTLWLVTAVLLKKSYFEQFRSLVSKGDLKIRAKAPKLDMQSLETVVSALNNENENVVIHALNVLNQQDKSNFIPNVILYHRSENVVCHAMKILEECGRIDHVPSLRLLMTNGSQKTRVTALRSLCNIGIREEDLLLAYRDQDSQIRIVAVTAMMIKNKLNSFSDLAPEEQNILKTSQWRIEFLSAVEAFDVTKKFKHIIDQFIEDCMSAETLDLAYGHALVKAISTDPQERHIPFYIAMLECSDSREIARMALRRLRPASLHALAEALDNPQQLPYWVRLHIPRTISYFGGKEAFDILVQRLLNEINTPVGYKIFRGVGKMVRENPKLSPDPEILDRASSLSIDRIQQLEKWILGLSLLKENSKISSDIEILLDLLQEKKITVLERFFRIQGIKNRKIDFEVLFIGIQSEDQGIYSGSRELLSQVVSHDVEQILIKSLQKMPKKTPKKNRDLEKIKKDKAKIIKDFQHHFKDMLNDQSPTIRTLSVAIEHDVQESFDLFFAESDQNK